MITSISVSHKKIIKFPVVAVHNSEGALVLFISENRGIVLKSSGHPNWRENSLHSNLKLDSGCWDILDEITITIKQ